MRHGKQGKRNDYRGEAGSEVTQDKQSWTMHDLVSMRPKTDNQRTAIEAWAQGDHLALLGSAGVGKTFLAAYLAGSDLCRNEVSQIIVLRSAVDLRPQGFRPGTQEEKDAPYEESYAEAFGKVFGHPMSYKWLKNRGKVRFRSTGNLRSLNFEDAVVIADEVQNMSFEELHTIVTRLSPTSRLIVCGDHAQCDLQPHEVRSLPLFERFAPELPNTTVVRFTMHDCLRHPLVKAWLGQLEKWHAERAERSRQPAPEPAELASV